MPFTQFLRFLSSEIKVDKLRKRQGICFKRNASIKHKVTQRKRHEGKNKKQEAKNTEKGYFKLNKFIGIVQPNQCFKLRNVTEVKFFGEQNSFHSKLNYCNTKQT